MHTFKQELNAKATLLENWLKTSLRTPPLGNGLPPALRQAMEYSLFAGGKRIRPVLCLSAAELFTEQTAPFLPFACAFEFIHTYSLIHDDLPAMDNDDLRRGKPSNHKQFTEATAILAGDALLTDAFALISSDIMLASFPPNRLLKALNCLARAAGSAGMVGGQFYDMEYTERDATTTPTTLEELAHMHAMKTGALLTSPCQCGAILAGAEEQAVQALTTFGQALGAAFQITDDILDVVGTEEELGKPVGSDAENNKLTYPSMLGLDKSRQLAAQYVEKGITALDVFEHEKTLFLRALAHYILSRAS